MTALAAVLIPAAILTVAVLLIANTADVDSMADPTPRLGEPDGDEDRPPALVRAQKAWFPDRSEWDQQ